MHVGTLTLLTLAAQLPVEVECPPPIVVVCPPCPCVCPEPAAAVSESRYVAAKPKDDEVLRWNEATLEAVRREKTPPPMAAHHLAMVHAAMYDAVNIVQPRYESYAVRGTTPSGTSAEAAAAVAAHRILIALYPQQTERFYRILDESMAGVPPGKGQADGITLGRLVAEKVLEWRRGDAEALRGGYTPSGALGRWKPTPPAYAPALLPHWQTLPCFALRRGSQFRPKPPPPLDSAAFVQAFQQVKAIGGVDSKVRTPEQTEIAQFWADNPGTSTPPGHWNRIAQTAALRRGNSLTENARLFALLNVALADAAVACWDCKYHYDYIRPVTAIREAAEHAAQASVLKKPALAADPAWLPVVVTPPFPSYTSGHSTFSAAAAAALAAFFGSDRVRFTSTSDGLPGVDRSYDSFRAAAKEAGMSRIYGGIHWDFDNAAGLALGDEVGRFVVDHYFRPRPVAGVRLTAR